MYLFLYTMKVHELIKKLNIFISYIIEKEGSVGTS